jgi:NhaA family Na+:H+ antiporter
MRFFRDFARIEASGSILLMVATVASLAWANSRWSELYFSVWESKAVIGVGAISLEKPLLAWINDALMALFFLVIGLEIKRELLVGPLADRRRAALPIAAAFGGMLLPAAAYAALNVGTPSARGWGIPMATDIAFALGILAVLRDRIPLGLKVFLAALAIADDLGAVLIIALFYTAKIGWLYLGIGGAFFGCLIAANAVGVRQSVVYGLLGFGLWVCFLKSGVHATVAGILLAATIPARARIDVDEFLHAGTGLLSQFRWAGGHGEGPFFSRERQAAVYALERACESVETPLQRLERRLHPWVTFAVLPLFALANAGVKLGGDIGSALSSPEALGVACGLLLGKPIGIVALSWLAVRIGLAALPAGVTWAHIWGAGFLAGIGFTMSLFIASLAFGQSPTLTMAKTGILVGSLASGVVGWALLRFAASPPTSLDER